MGLRAVPLDRDPGEEDAALTGSRSFVHFAVQRMSLLMSRR